MRLDHKQPVLMINFECQQKIMQKYNTIFIRSNQERHK